MLAAAASSARPEQPREPCKGDETKRTTGAQGRDACKPSSPRIPAFRAQQSNVEAASETSERGYE